MRHLGKVGGADPGGAFRSHLRRRNVVLVHDRCHAMTADTVQSDAAGRDLRRSVVGTA